MAQNTLRLAPLTAVFLVLVALPGCQFGPSDAQSGLPRKEIILTGKSGNTVKIQAEIADEPGARAQGLMSREALEEETGMLFVFETENPVAFWMKDTLIPLDILFFDSRGFLVSTQSMVPCLKDPCITYPSEVPARYALEVPGGFLKKHKVGAGWKMDIEM